MIKVPATRAGVRAIEELTARGVNVNVTLLFSVERYEEVIEAYLRGLSARVAAGEPLDGIASVASFFVSRIDTKADAALAPRTRRCAGRSRSPTRTVAYGRYLARFAGDALAARCRALAPSPQRPLWASTGTKDPTYSDVLYVEQLIAPGVINTMPEQTLRAFADHGEVAATLDADLDARRGRLGAAAEGVDLEAIRPELEREGEWLLRLLRAVAEPASNPRVRPPGAGGLTRKHRTVGSPTTIELPRAGVPRRIGGYAPICSYAAIGDGRTVALVARDGSIDWLAAARARLAERLRRHARRGARRPLRARARRALRGRAPLPAGHQRAGDDVLDRRGTVRVTDAMTLPGGGLGPLRELARRIEGLAGSVPMAWRVEPRFGYAGGRPASAGAPACRSPPAGGDALAVCAFDAGAPELGGGAIRGRFEARAGDARPDRAVRRPPTSRWSSRRATSVEARLDATAAIWRRWSDGLHLRGPLARRGDPQRAGAQAARPRPLRSGRRGGDDLAARGDRRRAQLGLPLLLGPRLRVHARTRSSGSSCAPEARAYFWWLMHASQLTHPRLRVLYRLDGGRARPSGRCRWTATAARARCGSATPPPSSSSSTPTASCCRPRGSTRRPAIGSTPTSAAGWPRSPTSSASSGASPTPGSGRCAASRAHFTQSKMMCWVALDRARELADRGADPRPPRRALARRRRTAIREFVETRCFSRAKGSYVRCADSDELDASLLLGVLFAYGDAEGRPLGRARSKRCAASSAHGPFVRRYTGEDGLAGSEGAFLACSFWLVEALARTGRVERGRPR